MHRRGQSCCAIDEARSFANLFLRLDHPVLPLTADIAQGRHTVGRSKIAVEFDGFTEQTESLVIFFLRVLIKARQAMQVVIIRVQAAGGFSLSAFDFSFFNFRR